MTDSQVHVIRDPAAQCHFWVDKRFACCGARCWRSLLGLMWPFSLLGASGGRLASNSRGKGWTETRAFLTSCVSPNMEGLPKAFPKLWIFPYFAAVLPGWALDFGESDSCGVTVLPHIFFEVQELTWIRTTWPEPFIIISHYTTTGLTEPVPHDTDCFRTEWQGTYITRFSICFGIPCSRQVISRFKTLIRQNVPSKWRNDVVVVVVLPCAVGYIVSTHMQWLSENASSVLVA